MLQIVAAIDSTRFDSDQKPGIYDNTSDFFVIDGWLKLEPELLRQQLLGLYSWVISLASYNDNDSLSHYIIMIIILIE